MMAADEISHHRPREGAALSTIFLLACATIESTTSAFAGSCNKILLHNSGIQNAPELVDVLQSNKKEPWVLKGETTVDKTPHSEKAQAAL